jgi:hypothetical protein
MTPTRNLIDRLVAALPGRSTLFMHLDDNAAVHATWLELVKDGGVDASQTRPPHYKANEDRIWLGADVRIGTLTILICGPMEHRPIQAAAAGG